MFISKEHLDKAVEEIIQVIDNRFDRLERLIKNQTPFTGAGLYQGERVWDNQDICQFLKISKRTLQRYRTSGLLKYKTILNKTYYLESDVMDFVEHHFKNESEQ